MPDARFPRGSLWRKWDLQVHTPYSALNNGFGNDFDVYAKAFFEQAIAKDVAVIGVTDYFSIEGYKQLRELQADVAKLTKLIGDELAERARTILLLPNIEFRTSVLITREGETSRVNFHVVFADQLDPASIDENFLRELRFTAQSQPDDPDERWSLTFANLSALGKKLKAQHEKFSDRSDLYVGMMNAVVSHDDVTGVLTRQASRFGEQYLLITPADEDLSECNWDGQGHLTRKLYIQKSHMLLSSNSSTRDFGLGLRHPTVAAFKSEFKSLKPCVHGSDAHSFEGLFEPALNRYLWIKADPTFEGLRQVLHEPADRIFIGTQPASLERVAARPTKVIDRLSIRKAPGSTLTEKWFDCDLPLNPELVAIIGNKGSGKSALADIVGLLGNTPRHDSFSFLRPDRFRNPKGNKARHFAATITWADATVEGPALLDRDPDAESVEKVRYIPQNYLEEICNEVGLGKDSRFYGELQQVIFSHVPESERQGFETLDQLLDHKGEEIKKGISLLTLDLSDINKNIVAIEERLTSRHRRSIEAQLAEKTRELEAHDLGKPEEVKKPDDDEDKREESQYISSQLKTKQASLAQLENKIKELRSSDARLVKQKTAAERLTAKLKNLQRQVEASLADAAADLAEVGVAWTDLVTFAVNTEPVVHAVTVVEAERHAIAASLDSNSPESVEGQRSSVAMEINRLHEALTGPEKAFQEYLQRLNDWTETRLRIAGGPDQPGTVGFFEEALAALDVLPEAIRDAEKERNRKALEILREKQRLRRYYEDYYGAVQEFLTAHPLAASDAFRVTFTVSMTQSRFAEEFLGKINRRKLGYFAGLDEGAAALRRLLEATDWNSARSTLQFAGTLIEHLKHDGTRDRDIGEQLVQGQTIESLYDYVFGFDYVSPIYRLTWDGKGLEQLSPGERGNLLLIFYLLVDREEIPLVIDQPEENLDNQTVVRTLVPCIKDAKRRRQIVMVTHNPNLAVVCDAEQVIHAEIRKDKNHEVSYFCGAIENPTINQKIVDVLEGTRPAFDQREARYQPADV